MRVIIGFFDGNDFNSFFSLFSLSSQINLVRQHERHARETIVGSAFGQGVGFVNQFLPRAHSLDYHAWDYKKGKGVRSKG